MATLLFCQFTELGWGTSWDLSARNPHWQLLAPAPGQPLAQGALLNLWEGGLITVSSSEKTPHCIKWCLVSWGEKITFPLCRFKCPFYSFSPERLFIHVYLLWFLVFCPHFWRHTYMAPGCVSSRSKFDFNPSAAFWILLQMASLGSHCFYSHLSKTLVIMVEFAAK